MAENINFLLSYAKETEAIRAAAGTDAWTRQMVLGQKRDAYMRILKCLNAYWGSLKSLLSYREAVWQQSELGEIPQPFRAQFSSRLTEHINEYLDSHSELSAALVEAELFIDPCYSPLLRECYSNPLVGLTIGKLDDGGDLDRSESDRKALRDKGFKERDFLFDWLNRLLAAARFDLGVDSKNIPSEIMDS
jgi:hypothetical protein